MWRITKKLKTASAAIMITPLSPPTYSSTSGGFGLGHFGHDFPGHVDRRVGDGHGPDASGPQPEETKEHAGKGERHQKQRHDEQRISGVVVIVGGEHERQVPDAMQETHQQHGRHNAAAEQARQHVAAPADFLAQRKERADEKARWIF